MHNDTPLGTAMHLKELDRHAAPKLGPSRAVRPETAAVTAARSALMALLRRLRGWFPGREQSRVSAGRLGDVLEGKSRPGHFDGVLTVVAKLMHLTRPDRAYFGQKDAQQLLLIRRMVRDLDVRTEVVAVPTVREPDGLAMSSRNTYLNALDREVALVLPRALEAGQDRAPEGASAVRRAARDVLVREPLCLVDYLVLVDPFTLEDVPEWYRGEALLAVAGRVGTTRLIDNVLVNVGADGPATL